MADRNPQGKLIVFEGIDGSGKTVQQLRMVRWLQQAGYEVLALCEPTYGPKGRILRESAREGRLTPEEELDLFIQDRTWNVEANIKPGLEQGKIVLLDRYYFSSIAYQGARGLDPDKIRRKNEQIAVPPDLLLLFDLDPEIADERIRQKRGETPNLFEALDYQRKVRAIFLSLQDDCLVKIDASRTEDEVWQQVEAALQRLLASDK